MLSVHHQCGSARDGKGNVKETSTRVKVDKRNYLRISLVISTRKAEKMLCLTPASVASRFPANNGHLIGHEFTSL